MENVVVFEASSHDMFWFLDPCAGSKCSQYATCSLDSEKNAVCLCFEKYEDTSVDMDGSNCTGMYRKPGNKILLTIIIYIYTCATVYLLLC